MFENQRDKSNYEAGYTDSELGRRSKYKSGCLSNAVFFGAAILSMTGLAVYVGHTENQKQVHPIEYLPMAQALFVGENSTDTALIYLFSHSEKDKFFNSFRTGSEGVAENLTPEKIVNFQNFINNLNKFISNPKYSDYRESAQYLKSILKDMYNKILQNLSSQERSEKADWLNVDFSSVNADNDKNDWVSKLALRDSQNRSALRFIG